MKNFLFSLVISLLMLLSAAEAKMWEQLKGPYGFYVNDFACDSKGNLFVISNDLGLMISRDHCKSWEVNQTYIKVPIMARLYIDNNDGIYIYGTDGFKYSQDGAKTWDSVTIPQELKFNIIHDLIKLPTGDLLISSDENIYKFTTDKNWRLIPVDSFGLYLYNIEVSSENKIFLNTDNYIYCSTDNGENWFKLNLKFFEYRIKQIKTLMNGVCIGYYTPFEYDYHVVISNDNGKNWNSINMPIGLGGSYLRDKFTNDSDGNIYFISGNSGPYKSSNRGSTWIDLKANIGSDEYSKLVADNLGNTYININGVTIRKKDSPVWESGHGNIISYSMYPVYSFGEYLFTTCNYLQRSSDHGNTWKKITNSIGNNMKFVDGTIYSLSSTLIYKSTDYGLTWTIKSFRTNTVNSIDDNLIVGPEGKFYIGTKNGVFFSIDSGKTFKEKWINGLDGLVSLAGIENNRLISYNEKKCYSGSLDCSDWVQLDYNLPENLKIRYFTIDQNGNLFIFGYNASGNTAKCFHSYDKGKNWNLTYSINGSGRAPIIKNGKIYCYDQYSVYFKKEYDGTLFQIFNPADFKTSIYNISVDDSENIYIGTYNNGIFKNTKKLSELNLFSSYMMFNIIEQLCSSAKLNLGVTVLDKNHSAVEGADVVYFYDNPDKKVETKTDEAGYAMKQIEITRNSYDEWLKIPMIISKEGFDNTWYHEYSYTFEKLLKLDLLPKDTINVEKGQSLSFDLKTTDCYNYNISNATIKVKDSLMKMEYTLYSYNDGTCIYPVNIPLDCLDGIYSINFHASKNNYIDYKTIENTYNVYLRVGNPNSVDAIASNEILSISPNPISGTATATVSLEGESFTQLDLYDIFGRKVLAIHTGWLRQGESNITFNTGNLPAGMYFVKLQTSGGATAIPVIIER